MTDSILISVIIPVYNTERFLRQCLRSVLRQSHRNLEVIVVNDAGPDRSLEILKEFEQKDSRLLLLENPENIGLSRSRFRGMEHASGKYIAHVDSDDWLPKNALEKLVVRAEQDDADVVLGSLATVMDSFGKIKLSHYNNFEKNFRTDTIGQPELFDDYFISYFGVNKLPVSVCAKLYKKSVLDRANLKPTDMFWGEDLLFNMNLHPFLNKISFIADTVYNYRWGGMTTRDNPGFLTDVKKLYVLKKEALRLQDYHKALPYIKFELANCFYSHFVNAFTISKRSRDFVLQLIEEELKDPVYKTEFAGLESSRPALIYEGNPELIVEEIYEIYRKDRRLYFLKQVLFRFLSLFQR